MFKGHNTKWDGDGAATMDGDRLDRRHLVAVAGVLAVVLAAGAFGWLTVADRGCSHVERVPPGASMSAEPSNETGTPGSVTVTWTSNPPTPEQRWALEDQDHEPADYLVVHWYGMGANSTTDGPTHTTGAVSVTDGTWRLAEVGHSITLTERNATSATAVRLVVTAIDGETETEMFAQTVTL